MNNEEYWKRRFKLLESSTYKESQQYYRNIQKFYEETKQSLDECLLKFYSQFADLENISYREAKKILDQDQLEAFHMSIEKYIKYGEEQNVNWNKDIDKLMKEASLKYRITRLDAFKYQLIGETAILTNKEINALFETLTNAYIDRYYRTAFEIFKNYGVGYSFEMVDLGKLESILNRPWTVDGLTFSDRLWTRQEKLVNQLTQTLAKACERGEGYTETTEYLAKAMSTTLNNAGRLVVTESAYFSSESQNNCFNELGVNKYSIVVTLDSKTDPDCYDLDGEVYNLKDFEIGVTAPPYHPNCRCTTAPYVDDSNLPGYLKGTRTARNGNGKTYRVPRDMTYKQWREKYNIEPKN